MNATIEDVSLGGVDLPPNLQAQRAAYFRSLPEVCVERARLVTKYSSEMGLFGRDRISMLEKGKLYRKVLENREPIVWHRRAFERSDNGPREFAVDDVSPFAGSTTSKFKGVPLYPEFMGLALWPELGSLPKRGSNPYAISEDEARTLNLEVFPAWLDHTILELARKEADSENRKGLRLLQKLVFFLASKPECISHTIPDFSRAVNQGLRAVIADAAGRAARPGDPATRDCYLAMIEALEGIIAYSRNIAAAAAGLAARESSRERRSALQEIAAIYRHVPEHPARTFREGLTTVWICWTAVHLENPNIGLSLGRLDQLLYPLFRQDVALGTLTIARAVELLGFLWLKIGDHVPMVPEAAEQLFGGTGSNQAITIGGTTPEGDDGVNDLTYVMLRATELMQLRDPNLNARFDPDINGAAYLRRLCEANINTGATPALHNDRAVVAALTATGHTLREARDYGIIGCVEPGSNGRFYGASASVFINLPSVLELTLFNGRHRHLGLNEVVSPPTGDPATFSSFEEFRGAFTQQLRWLVDRAVALNELFGRMHQRYYPTPVLSALFEGPMEKGKDLIDGGATINSSGVTVIGLADVADSLTAIETHVFGSTDVSFATLIDALAKDYEGHETLLARLRNPEKTPRFGNDHPRADGNARWLIRSLHQSIETKRNYRGGKYRVGYWTMTNHAGFGRLTGATPNGRKAGENLSSGLTPNSGVTPFLVPALRSIASVPMECTANGMAVNLKFTPDDGDRERMLEFFVAAVRGYFDCTADGSPGGMEIQFNVTSHQRFLEAMKNPSQYAELLVRVSGYTAYFKDLNPQMQKEIIDRTEYRLSTGKAVPYDPFPLPGRSDA